MDRGTDGPLSRLCPARRDGRSCVQQQRRQQQRLERGRAGAGAGDNVMPCASVSGAVKPRRPRA